MLYFLRKETAEERQRERRAALHDEGRLMYAYGYNASAFPKNLFCFGKDSVRDRDVPTAKDCGLPRELSVRYVPYLVPENTGARPSFSAVWREYFQSRLQSGAGVPKPKIFKKAEMFCARRIERRKEQHEC